MEGNFRPQGLPCPECNTRIIIDISDLLMTGKIVCPQCALELVVDQQKSRTSMEVLSDIQDEFRSSKTYFEERQYTERQGERNTRVRRKRQSSRRVSARGRVR